jgi:hypothetical protein
MVCQVPCTPGSTRERSASLRRPFIHAIEGHHRNFPPRHFLALIYGWFTEEFDTAELQEAKTPLDAPQ